MTNYYIRTFESTFSHNWNENTGVGEKPLDSDNEILTSFIDEATTEARIRTKDGNFFSYTAQRVFHVGSSVYPPQTPLGSAAAAFYSKLLDNSYFTWNDKRFDTALGFSGASWLNTYTWTNPDTNYTVWLQEIVDFVDNQKGSMTDWGTDTDIINIYVFKYKYANQPSTGWGYFPLFFMGNDAQYDVILTPTA